MRFTGYDLSKDARKKQAYFICKRKKELLRESQDAAIIRVVSTILETQSRIWSAKQV